MVTLADFSDTASLMTCNRCGQLLEERDRFCRFCGQDQLDTDPDAPPVMPALIDITQPPANGERVTPTETRRRFLKKARRAEPDPNEMLADRGPGGSVSPGRWALGAAAAVVVVLAVALVHDLYQSRQEESTRRAELGFALAQVEEALGRGDLKEVQLKLAILDALNPNDADIKVKREAFDRRVQEMTAERDRLRATMAKEQGASGAGPAPPSAAPAAAATSATVQSAAITTPPAAVPAPSAPTPSAAAPAPVTPTPSVAVAPSPRAAPVPTQPASTESIPAAAPARATGPVSPPAPSAQGDASARAAPAASSPGCPEALAALALCPKQ